MNLFSGAGKLPDKRPNRLLEHLGMPPHLGRGGLERDQGHVVEGGEQDAAVQHEEVNEGVEAGGVRGGWLWGHLSAHHRLGNAQAVGVAQVALEHHQVGPLAHL